MNLVNNYNYTTYVRFRIYELFSVCICKYIVYTLSCKLAEWLKVQHMELFSQLIYFIER